ncbi:MAG: MBL fold metallo-hydrolase [Bariatricus sp.]
MKLTMLGTGHALVQNCYNTCFVLHEEDQYFLVDGGGGNGIFRQLDNAGIDWKNIKNIFVTHKHMDHITGVIWIIRVICEHMRLDQYDGQVKIYAHGELVQTIKDICFMLLQPSETAFLDKRILFVELADGDEHEILNRRTTFFDIQSRKAKQFGFTMCLGQNNRLTCCGDEPYRPCELEYAWGSTWLMHEAFCLDSQADQHQPYQHSHSTVRSACQAAEFLGVKNLVLYHTEDDHLKNRKTLYTGEGSKYFGGKIYVPDDLEEIMLSSDTISTLGQK